MSIAMFKTQMKPQVVSLQSFEHFDVTAMVDKITDHWKVVVDLFFYNNLDGFEVVVFRKNARARKKNTNWTTVSSFSWSVLLSTTALQPRSQGFSLSLDH